jgi:hypothetical protein
VKRFKRTWFALTCLSAISTNAFSGRVSLEPSMVVNESELGDASKLVDEQAAFTLGTDGKATGAPSEQWQVPSQHWKSQQPVHAYIDLGAEKNLSSIWIYDTNGKGEVILSAGQPRDWKQVTTYDCGAYKKWVEVPLSVKTRYLRITRQDGGSNFSEIALFDMTDAELAETKAKAQAEQKAAEEKAAAAAKLAAEREAGRAKAQAELANRKVVDLGEPFGQATLVDEIDVAAADPGHLFKEFPAGVSKVETILGQPARVLSKTADESAHMTFRIGQYKLLKPGAAYVLDIEYPEDAPRTWVVLNAGNESSMGFHTGNTVGDAFHPKYVNNLNESIDVPLSGKYENWRMYFNLHDAFVNETYVRGDGERPLTPDDGFTVTIAQYSARNIPMSRGAAVSKIRLYEVADSDKLAAKYTLPPEGLPQRHLFWREEMADNVIAAEKKGTAGVSNPIDWYKYKANQMQVLGLNTYAKDLLEFGAVQHWDTTAHGGNEWAYYNAKNAPLWSQIVKLMGERGYSILPYYEYSGSKGRNGLGPQRRARPLTRDDAYSHIKWIESANADITDPEAIEDFKKMLDITIIREKGNARFLGAWLRPRAQLPMGFGDVTRKRFADEANNGREITRQQLLEDATLLNRYKEWWFGKRKEFLAAARDYLRENGVEDAMVLFTAVPSEPGVGFPTWDPIMVADKPEPWRKLLGESSDEKEQKMQVWSVQEVVDQNLYLSALLAEPKTWGKWELQHSSPPSDPQHYKDADGLMMSYAFNRNYTVGSPEALEAFRSPAGLTMLRYYSLNENMMFDKEDKPTLGYFCADMERAGPYCMMAEALAMANGNPTNIGYLRGRVFARGFPQYVRNFNTAFLSLPALPSERVEGAASDKNVVVRKIATPNHGTYYAVINTGMTDAKQVRVRLTNGSATDAASGEAIAAEGDSITLDIYPFQMRAIHVK